MDERVDYHSTKYAMREEGGREGSFNHLLGSEVAIATIPRWLKRIREWNSSAKGSPYIDSPPS